MGESAKSALVLLTQEQLKALVSDAVRDALANTNAERSLHLDEIAQELDVSTRTIRNWVNQLGMPCLRAGASELRFDRADVRKWMQERASAHGAHVTRHLARAKKLEK